MLNALLVSRHTKSISADDRPFGHGLYILLRSRLFEYFQLWPGPVVKEPFSKWGAQMHVQKAMGIFVVWIGNLDATSIETWRQ